MSHATTLTANEFYDLRDEWKTFSNLESKLETIKHDKIRCFKIVNSLEERKHITPNRARALRSFVRNDCKVKADTIQRLLKIIHKEPASTDSSIYYSIDIAKDKIARKTVVIANLQALIKDKQAILEKHKARRITLEKQLNALTAQAKIFESITKIVKDNQSPSFDDDEDEDMSDSEDEDAHRPS